MLDDLLDEWCASYRPAFEGIRVIGTRWSRRCYEMREFLARNGYPYTYVDLDTDKMSQELLDRFSVKIEEVPIVICNARSVLRNPSIRELADCLGLNLSIDESQVRDLIVVGAGPSGLAAAVYAASEGLNVLVVETATAKVRCRKSFTRFRPGFAALSPDGATLAVLPINFNTLYEVHLFSLLPCLVAWLLLLSSSRRWARGTALAILCASAWAS